MNAADTLEALALGAYHLRLHSQHSRHELGALHQDHQDHQAGDGRNVLTAGNAAFKPSLPLGWRFFSQGRGRCPDLLVKIQLLP